MAARDSEKLSLDEIASLARAAFDANGCDGRNSRALTKTVVDAERDCAESHGLFRVPGYIASLRSGKVNGQAQPTVTRSSNSVLQLNGDSGFAPLAIETGIPALIGTAKETGVAIMAARNVHHYAALWPETEAIANAGLVGLACVNYVPVVAPFGGTTPLFGTNPFSFAWPRPGQAPVTIDMATSAMAQGEVQIAHREGRQVPLGVGIDSAGNETTSPGAILAGTMLPFGGHKGSAIALIVELLAGGLIGDRFSFESKAEDNDDGGPPPGGEFFMAIDPGLIAGPDWSDHCENFFARYANVDGARLPGEKRHANRSNKGPRSIDAELVETIRGLC